jgi:TetR/AcrR family transcriptional repressor of mexJK operon
MAAQDPTPAPRRAARGPRERGPDPRTLRTRAAVAEAATTLFLRNGYQATSVDDIAELASVSKRSIYNNFTDKESLFTELVLGFTETAESFAGQITGDLTEAADPQQALYELGRRQLRTVAVSQVLRLRRLIIIEAARFPGLAEEYYRCAPGRVIAALSLAFAELHRRGDLTAPDPDRAAQHFSYLVLGHILDTFLFDPDGGLPPPAHLDQIADDGVRAFLAAYGPHSGRP